jgi:hypothetical protein
MDYLLFVIWNFHYYVMLLATHSTVYPNFTVLRTYPY